MSKPKVTIFTCSYNKPQYVLDAILSVLNQSFANFEYIILENSTDNTTRSVVHNFTDNRVRIIDINFTDTERKKFYVESFLKNTYFAKARGEFIMYLADDDILDPMCFEEHVKEFESNKDQKINFHSYKTIYLGSKSPKSFMNAYRNYGLNTNRSPGIRIDGGSVMFEKHLLEKISKPYFKLGWKNAHISDGLFLNKLAKVATFYPISKVLHTKRVTEISTHAFVDKLGNVTVYRPGKLLVT